MCDCYELVTALRCCAENQCEICPRGDTQYGWIECKKKLTHDVTDAIEELVAAVPQWISVEERLPEVTTKVLTYNGTFVSENWLCTIADKDGKREIWAYSEGFVTHWMPLPKPPKEVE